jgi:hypothetical protein
MSETDSSLQIRRSRICKPWTDEELQILREQYPSIGLQATAFLLACKPDRIRSMASRLGIKQDKDSMFHKQWVHRSAITRTGKKRPAQAEVMRQLHRDGKLLQSPESRKRSGAKLSKIWKAKGHPRGALGLRHTKNTRQVLGDKSRAGWKRMTMEQRMERQKKIVNTKVDRGVFNTHPRGTWKAAWREIGGIRKFYRSRWEANYARFLQWQKERGEVASWTHESEVFWFDGIKRGCVSYLPDFKVILPNGAIEYHEVKGWMDPASKTKIKRMKKYHPSVKLVVVDSKSYLKLERLMQSTVPGWEAK